MLSIKETYLIYESHGEYDDYTEIPIVTVDDMELAIMLADDLYTALILEEGELWKMIKDYNISKADYNPFGIREIYHFELV
jgi:hypothetical protein